MRIVNKIRFPIISLPINFLSIRNLYQRLHISKNRLIPNGHQWVEAH
jgi:hypothetical protein